MSARAQNSKARSVGMYAKRRDPEVASGRFTRTYAIYLYTDIRETFYAPSHTVASCFLLADHVFNTHTHTHTETHTETHTQKYVGLCVCAREREREYIYISTL